MKFSLFRGDDNKISRNIVFLSVYGCEYYDIESLNRKFKQIESNFKVFSKLLKEKDKLSNEEFARIYAAFYHPNTHLINLCMTDDKGFSNPKVFKLKSDDLIFIEKNPSPNSTGFYGEYYYANYNVLAEKDFKEKNGRYTKQEIVDLANSRKVAIIDKTPSHDVAFDFSQQKKGDKKIIELAKTKVPYASANYPTYDLKKEDIEEFLAMYPKVLKLLRKDLDEESIKNQYEIVAAAFAERKKELNEILGKVVSGRYQKREKIKNDKYVSDDEIGDE